MLSLSEAPRHACNETPSCPRPVRARRRTSGTRRRRPRRRQAVDGAPPRIEVCNVNGPTRARLLHRHRWRRHQQQLRYHMPAGPARSPRRPPLPSLATPAPMPGPDAGGNHSAPLARSAVPSRIRRPYGGHGKELLAAPHMHASAHDTKYNTNTKYKIRTRYI